MKKKTIWIGPRESDTYYSNVPFFRSVTYNGDAVTAPHAFTNQINTRINQYNSNMWNLPRFLREELLSYVGHPDVQFMFYNPLQSYMLGEQYLSQSICCSPRHAIEVIRHKGKMRSIASEYINVVPFVHFSGNIFPQIAFKEKSDGTYILQKVISSGGYETRKMSLDECTKYTSENSSEQEYILSPYLTNAVPINVHMVIFDDDCIVFPPSLQILQESHRHFIYIGADFHTNFTSNIYGEIINSSQKIADCMRNMGYRGVCGIDYMLTQSKLLFLEVNARFQSSTFLLNRLLLKEQLPSVHELNIMAFEHEKCPIDSFTKFDHPQSFFTVMGNHIPNWYSDDDDKLPKVIDTIIRDGFSSKSKTTVDAYLFRALVNRNLGWINPDNELNIAPNIRPDSKQWEKEILSNSLLKLKISILNQGVRISPNAITAMQKLGYIREGVFQSVDLFFPNGLVINAPCKTEFSELSPYYIEYSGSSYVLMYNNELLTEISFDVVDTYSQRVATNGTLYRQAAFWATDRLRIHHQFRCIFKEQNQGCKFCNIKLKEGNFLLSDVFEIIDFYLQNVKFNHFLIGGGSGSEMKETQNIIAIAQHIRKQSSKPIYAMCLPPQNVSILYDYKNAGINEIGFNIEFFDREIAKKLMPGKGAIPISQYENAFIEAVKIWNSKGNVRSMMVLGLESLDSFYSGVEWLCKLGVMPIISIFRPMRNMYMKDALPICNEKIKKIYDNLLEITAKYNLKPGPSCIYCQNNTLSMPD
ncbi:MAG: ATP-grasp domain-containing protein [Lachnospiraceae bacterium]|nr:ATP-grasp domain-containing protein [Lachnospiraceae bacterium]